jgi:hypothetical protein
MKVSLLEKEKIKYVYRIIIPWHVVLQVLNVIVQSTHFQILLTVD